jgi:uncharacterized protein involved in response to NO
MSARFFPLYLGVRPAPPAGLNLTLALVLAGIGGRCLAVWLPATRAVGDVLVGLGLLVAVWSLFQVAPGPNAAPASGYAWLPIGLVRRPPPPPGRARPATPAMRAARWLVRSAYLWLLLAAGLALARGLGWGTGWAPPVDAERHALGAGFVTLLILGMGTLLLPGLVGGRAPDRPAVAACWLGSLAALLRVLPVIVGWLAPAALPGPVAPLLMGLAGVLGLAAIACLAAIVRGARRGPAGPTP